MFELEHSLGCMSAPANISLFLGKIWLFQYGKDYSFYLFLSGIAIYPAPAVPG